MENLEKYFESFRNNIIGINAKFQTPFGEKKIIYTDWIASGRLYAPIEDKISKILGPFVGNPHTDSNITSGFTTEMYEEARHIIKKHVNANDDDVLIAAGYGMTAAINKLQRILGLRVDNYKYFSPNYPIEYKPVVFVTRMEHHSNQISWLTTVADVELIDFDEKFNVDYNDLEEKLEKYKHRKLKIGSFSSASNVTGVTTNVHKLAKIMHKHGGYCFIDYAGGAPYLEINMHPDDKEERLDAIFFSPHKFLGGPGSNGILIMSKSLDDNVIPDHPGGGPVAWTDPWGGYKFFEDVELREDAGTPGFIQMIKAALAIKLKEEMGVDNILAREHEIIDFLFDEFAKIDGMNVLLMNRRDRIGAISFTLDGLHYNLVTKLLNDKYGIRVRGGCACAGTYGHILLNISREESKIITHRINEKDLSIKPGFVRLSIHPTTTSEELKIILEALKDINANKEEYKNFYDYDKSKNEFYHKEFSNRKTTLFD